MSLPVIMPSNNSNAHRLELNHPGRMALLMGPGGWRTPRSLPFSLDNGRFVCWSKGQAWDESEFNRLTDAAMLHAIDGGGCFPSWLVVPDVVGDAVATFEEWRLREPRLRQSLGVPLALAVQDGMTPESVRNNANPDVIFIGGSTEWKRRTVWNWCHEFPRVHVGRVNTAKWLWNAHRCGAESTDGTGWFRGDKRQLRGLVGYLQRSDKGLGPFQQDLEFARTFGGNVPKVSATGG